MKKKDYKPNQHIENDNQFQSLNVNKGIEQPPSIDPGAVKRFKRKKRGFLSAEEYFEGIKNGNRTLLSQAITLVESSLPEHQAIAQKVIEYCLPLSGKSIRIGITGVPGVGKSTFIEAIGGFITEQDRQLAVLAIDPSSERSGGSILGDKTRMETLVNNERAYIRPSPSAGSLGGVARKTRETVILCEASGFDTIFIETVGVGQSETAVHSMVDFFLLLMLGGAGDELQGIKRGIMEMADAIAITKSDGGNEQKAKMARMEYENALHLFPATDSGWIPKVSTCSSVSKTGLDAIWETIMDYEGHTRANNYFAARRTEQSKYWMYETINDRLKSDFYLNPEIKLLLEEMEEKLIGHQVTSFEAARKLLEKYQGI